MTKKGYPVFLIVILLVSFLIGLPQARAENKITEEKSSEATSIDPSNVDIGFASRDPISDGSIDPHLVFDGANYIYVTNYGNYTWLQPLYYLKVEDLNGTELISKSVFILQENSTGTWLALLDFQNVKVSEANDWNYTLTYEVVKKSKGKDYVVGNVVLSFDLVHSLAKPKISLSLTRTQDWFNLGLNHFRWIWDLVPSSPFKYWTDDTNKQNIELPTTNLIDLGLLSESYLCEVSDYEGARSWLQISYEDVQFPCLTQGGKEPYWNSRGIVVVFPVDLAEIDPSTVATGYDASATRIEQQRKVFRNPRGQENYYALMETASGTWTFYRSADGSIWSSTGVSLTCLADANAAPSLTIYEDASNSRLLVYTVWLATDKDVQVTCYSIADSGTDPSSLWSNEVAVETEDGTYNPVISLGGNGYLWAVWVDEWTSAGKQRGQVRAACTTTTYPTSAPTWTSAVDIWDATVRINSYIPKCSVVPLTATANVAINYIYYNVATTTYYLSGKTGSYAGSGSPSAGNEVAFSTPSSDMLHSSIAETGDNSDVFVLLESSTPTLICEKWDVSGDSKSSYGTVYSGNVDSLALSIDKTSSPDKLYAFYVKNGVTEDVFYKTIFIASVWQSYYNAGNDPNNAWSNDANAWDSNEATYASQDSGTDENSRLEGTSLASSSGTESIVKVEIGLTAHGDLTVQFSARPVFDGSLGDEHQQNGVPTTPATFYWDVTEDTNAPTSWTWTDVQNIDIRTWRRTSNVFKIYEFIVRVNYVSWSSETTIDDDSEALKYLSASYQDWNGDSKVQIIYTTQTNKYVRFTEVGGPAGESYFVDVTLSLTVAFTKTTESTFNLNPQFQPTLQFQKTTQTDFALSSQLSPNIDFQNVLETTFNLVFQFPPSFSLSMDTETNYNVLPQLGVDVDFSKVLQSSLSALTQFNPSIGFQKQLETAFNIVVAFQPTIGFLVDVVHTLHEAVEYVVDLAYSVPVAFQKQLETSFNVGFQFQPNIGFDKLTEAFFNILPQFSPSITFEKITQGDFSALTQFSPSVAFSKFVGAAFNIAVDFQPSISFLTDIVHTLAEGIAYVVDIALSVPVAFQKQLSSTFNVAIDLQPALSFLTDLVTGVSNEVNLAFAPVISFIYGFWYYNAPASSLWAVWFLFGGGGFVIFFFFALLLKRKIDETEEEKARQREYFENYYYGGEEEEED